MKFVQSLARERAECNRNERRRGEAAYAHLTKLWRGMEAATEGISDCGEPRLAELVRRPKCSVKRMSRKLVISMLGSPCIASLSASMTAIIMPAVATSRAAERRLGELLTFLHIEGRELASMLGEEVE